MIKKIEFTDKELKEALAKYFEIPEKEITFWYIRSILKNRHEVWYREDRLNKRSKR